MNVSLPQRQQDYIDAKVQSGHYASAADVVSEALRLMEEYETMKLAALRAAVKEGLDSELEPEPFDFAAYRAERRARRSASDA